MCANDVERPGSEPSMQWLLFPWLSRPLHTLITRWDSVPESITQGSMPLGLVFHINLYETLRLNSAEFQSITWHTWCTCMPNSSNTTKQKRAPSLIYNILHFSLYLLHQWSHVGLMGPTSVQELPDFVLWCRGIYHICIWRTRFDAMYEILNDRKITKSVVVW